MNVNRTSENQPNRPDDGRPRGPSPHPHHSRPYYTTAMPSSPVTNALFATDEDSNLRTETVAQQRNYHMLDVREAKNIAYQNVLRDNPRLIEDYRQRYVEICSEITARNTSIYGELAGTLRLGAEKTADSENVIVAITAIADPHALADFDALNHQDLHLLLDRALGMLPDGARAVVESCDLLELPHREASARLGLSVSALETRLHRAHRSLRHLLSGPLRTEAESLGLMLEQVPMAGWLETRLWCSLCGRRRLHGMFLPSEPEGSQNLHLRCPDCVQRYGLDTIHSMGLVQLDGLRSFRPAWKRTMQELTAQLSLALARGWHPCPRCGTQALIEVIDSNEAITSSSHPYQFSIGWQCHHCGGRVCSANELPSVSEIVYWSHPQTRQFILQHPQLLRTPERRVEYAGQPAICVQMSDTTSTAGMTVLAHRQTLTILSIDRH